MIVFLALVATSDWSNAGLRHDAPFTRTQIVTPDPSPLSFSDQWFVVGTDNISSPVGRNRPTFATAIIADPNAFPTASVQVRNYVNYEGPPRDDQHLWLSVRILQHDEGVVVVPEPGYARMGLIAPGSDAAYTVTFPDGTPAHVEFEVDGSTNEAVLLTVLQVALETSFSTADSNAFWRHQAEIRQYVSEVVAELLISDRPPRPLCTNVVTVIKRGNNNPEQFTKQLQICLDSPEWQASVDQIVERLATRAFFHQILESTGQAMPQLKAELTARSAESFAMQLWVMYQKFHPEVEGAMVGSVAFRSVDTISNAMPADPAAVPDIGVHEVVTHAQEAIETERTYRFEGLVSRLAGPTSAKSGFVNIELGSAVKSPPSGEPSDIVTMYVDYASDTVTVELADGSFEDRTFLQPPEREPIVDFLSTQGADWTLLGTDRIKGKQAYVRHRVLPGQAFEGFDLLESLWIDADSFFPIQWKLTSNDGALAFLDETVYFAFGIPVDVAVPQDAVQSLAAMLPIESEFPFGLTMTGEGARIAEEITQTFPDPVDASQRFTEWGWQENAYRDFASPDGATALSVSLHRFADVQSASEALPYLAEASRIVSGFEPVAIAELGDKSEAIAGQVAGGRELSVYVQVGDVVARISVVTPTGDPLPIAMTTARALLGKTGENEPVDSSSKPRG